MMSIEAMEQFLDQELPEHVNAVRFDLRHHDVRHSARLLEAAGREEWDAVASLLRQGADPRICRLSDGTTCESALYLALKARRFEIAEALYDAGDRLDDLRTGDNAIPAEVLDFLAFQAADGNDFFQDGSKPLSECVRCGLWAQVAAKMAAAPQDELDRAAAMIGLWLDHRNVKPYLLVLRELRDRGAAIAQFRGEMLKRWERFGKMPKVFRPDEECFRRIVEIVKNA